MKIYRTEHTCSIMSGYNENVSVRATPKQSLKWIEIPVRQFTEVAVPHHVDLLHKHRANIEKLQKMGEWERVHHEQINATRLIKQLKALLYDMDTLRGKVQDSDVQTFDRLTDKALKNAQDAIKEYLDGQTEPVLEQTSNLHVQITKSASSEEMEKQEQCLKSWEDIQTEVQDVHQLLEDFSVMVQQQKEKTDSIEDNMEEALVSVKEGSQHIRRAAGYRASIYPIAGAVIGGCLGGPVGLIAGMKLGGLAAVGCGFIGYAGGRLLKKKQQKEESKSDVELVSIKQSRSLKGSLSLPHRHVTE